MRRKALTPEVMTPETVYKIREKMDQALARKLQPCYVCNFFRAAMKELRGDVRKLKGGRYEIRSVPRSVRESDRLRAVTREVITSKYECVCFEKNQIQPLPQYPRATFLHLGHPLMSALVDATILENKRYLGSGTVLVNRYDEGTEPSVVLMLEHRIRESEGDKLASHRLFFVRVYADGRIVQAGFAPHLDAEEPTEQEREQVKELIGEAWLRRDLSKQAVDFANVELQSTVAEVMAARRDYLNKAWTEAYNHLNSQIDYYNNRALQLDEEVAAGRQPLVQPQNFRDRARKLSVRISQYRSKIERQKQLLPESPTILGAYLEVPRGWFDKHSGGTAAESRNADASAREKIEKIAMNAVLETERRLGYEPVDVSRENCGWDITSRPIGGDPSRPARYIEVKGRAAGAEVIGVTCNEFCAANNLKEKHILALVLVAPDDSVEDLRYIKNCFAEEIDPASRNYKIKDLLSRAVAPEESV